MLPGHNRRGVGALCLMAIIGDEWPFSTSPAGLWSALCREGGYIATDTMESVFYLIEASQSDKKATQICPLAH